MHFEQDILGDAEFGGFSVDRLQQFERIHGVDEQLAGRGLSFCVKKAKQFPHFIGLQMSDEMPVNVRRQLGEFDLQLLHAAFAEMAFAGFVRFANSFYGLKLAHAHERDARGYMRAHVPYILCYTHCAFSQFT